MSPVRTITAALLLTAATLSPADAGEIEPRLAARLSTSAVTEFVPVWIQLPRTESVAALKASAGADLTRAQRYRLTADRLRRENAGAQQALLARLRDLEAQGVVRDVRARGISNVVTCEVAAGDLIQLAERSDVERIYAVPETRLIEPDKDAQAMQAQAGVETNLVKINADDAWAAGYTGEGTVICTFDTGVDGTHPALRDTWKGLDGDSAAAWFDPKYRLPLPHTTNSSNHGTHVMGIMCGHNDATGDTVGVALDARWISAGVIDVQGATILDAFEWAANPDGDWNTVDDVPDVINHSWGVPNAVCADLFYDMIDNTEALGIINVFAAGNDGPAIASIRNPADRALDSLDCFAAGNVRWDGTDPVIYLNSSLGPSPCNGAIKPNVCAPGYAIRSTYPGTGYGTLTGTSMAAPHVSGLCALLRQKNPDATVDQVKAAILTTARDFSFSLPNNTYGWGIIDCMAALNALPLPTTPELRVWAFDHPPISPASSVTGTVVIENAGGGALTGVTGTLLDDDPLIVINDGTVSFGSIGPGDTVRSVDQIQAFVTSYVQAGDVRSLRFVVSDGSGAYRDTVRLYFAVDPPLSRSYATHDNGRIEFTLSNFRSYGAGDGSFFPGGGQGFHYEGGGANDIWESGLIIGTDSLRVSDGVRNLAYEPDGDFRVLPGGNIALIEPGLLAPQQTSCEFDDSRSENPLGLSIAQSSYQWDDVLNDNYVILRYIVTNTSAETVSGLYFGLYIDWDLTSYSSNAGAWEAGEGISWMSYFDGFTYSNFRGVKVLDGGTGSAFLAEGTMVQANDGFREAEKYGAVSDGFSTASTYRLARKDLNQAVAAGPLTLASGATDTVSFAVLAGDSYAEIAAAALQATAKYDTYVGNCCIGLAGNVSGDEQDLANVIDMTWLTAFLFSGGPPPPCFSEADCDRDGNVNIIDMTWLTNFLFSGGNPPKSCY